MRMGSYDLESYLPEVDVVLRAALGMRRCSWPRILAEFDSDSCSIKAVP